MTRQEPSGEISRRRWTRRLLRRSAVISALAITLIGCGKGDSDSGVAPVNRSGDYVVSLDAPTGNLLSGRMRISPDGVVTNHDGPAALGGADRVNRPGRLRSGNRRYPSEWDFNPR